jgi:hypothetical protein
VPVAGTSVVSETESSLLPQAVSNDTTANPHSERLIFWLLNVLSSSLLLMQFELAFGLAVKNSQYAKDVCSVKVIK